MCDLFQEDIEKPDITSSIIPTIRQLISAIDLHFNEIDRQKARSIVLEI